MRKYKLIAAAAVVVLALSATGIYTFNKHRQQAQTREVAAAEQERAEQLSEWQDKVKMWEEQSQTETQSNTAAQSDLEEQGVTMLPDTGPGHVAAVFILVTLLSSVSYLFINKYLFSRYF